MEITGVAFDIISFDTLPERVVYGRRIGRHIYV